MNVSKSKPSIQTRHFVQMGTKSHLNLKPVSETENVRVKSIHSFFQTLLFCSFVVKEQGRLELVCRLGKRDPLVHQSDGWWEEEDTWPPHTSPSSPTDPASIITWLMVPHNEVQPHLIWNSVFCSDQQYATTLKSSWKKPNGKKFSFFVKIEMRAPPSSQTGTLGQRFRRLLFAGNSEINWGFLKHL